MTRRLSFDHTPKLLALRHTGTTDVALLWSRRRHRAAITVDDDATGEHFELLVQPDDNPLDLYQHPYVYAYTRRLYPNEDVPHAAVAA
jgi:hypothetical protein